MPFSAHAFVWACIGKKINRRLLTTCNSGVTVVWARCILYYRLFSDEIYRRGIDPHLERKFDSGAVGSAPVAAIVVEVSRIPT